MPPTKTDLKQGPRTSKQSSAVSRNVAAVRDKIIDSVGGSLNAVLLTRKNIEEVIEDAVARGRMTRADAQEMMQSLLTRGTRATRDLVSDIERLIGRPGSVDSEPPKASARLPIVGYDDLSAAQVGGRLAALTPAELRKVRDYERRHANRKTVLEPIERRLG